MIWYTNTTSICAIANQVLHLVDPFEIPSTFAEGLLKFHRFPPVWWIGQLVRYFAPETDVFNNVLEERLKTMNMDSPIVG